MITQPVKNETHENNPLHFYEVMNYPIPLNKEYFFYNKKSLKKEKLSNIFSRTNKSPYHDEYLRFINKRSFLYRNLPFIKEIYLANSITFNALKEDSDIDLFVICENWRVRTARFFMSILFFMYWLKRSKNNERKKFCLSFFVDEDHSNLEKLLQSKKDIYLPYRITHLVPLYYEKIITIYKNNKRVKNFLPQYPENQTIFLWNKYTMWNWKIKEYFERSFSWSFWDNFENFLQKRWGKRIAKIKEKNPVTHKWIITEKWILKFYYDKRKRYSDLFFKADN